MTTQAPRAVKRRDPARLSAKSSPKPAELPPILAAAERPAPMPVELTDRSPRADRLRDTKCRLMAWLVCRSLGDAWRVEELADSRGWRDARHLVHRSTGCVLSFSRCWRTPGRYRIGPAESYDREGVPTITVAESRSAASIARDIERRIVRVGLLEAYAGRVRYRETNRERAVRIRRRVVAVAEALGTKVRHEPHRNREQHTARREWGEPGGNYGDRSADVLVCEHLEMVEMTFRTVDVSLAVAVAELIRGFYERGGQA